MDPSPQSIQHLPPTLLFDLMERLCRGGYSEGRKLMDGLRTLTRGGDFNDWFNKVNVKTGNVTTALIVDDYYCSPNHGLVDFSVDISTIAIALGTRTAAELSAIQEFFIQYRNL